MPDETALDNRETATWINHDLMRNNKLAFSSMTNLHFYHFQMLKYYSFLFQLMYKQRIDNINNISSGVHSFTGKTVKWGDDRDNHCICLVAKSI